MLNRWIKRVALSEGKSSASDRSALKSATAAGLYNRAESFTDLLPWVEYLSESGCFLLEDGVSVGALLELLPVGTDGRGEEFLVRVRDAIQVTINDSLPEDSNSPWVVQFFLQDDPGLDASIKEIGTYGSDSAKATPYFEVFGKLTKRHLERISETQGYFHDQRVTGAPWRGQLRRVRATVYRRLSTKSKVDLDQSRKALEKVVSGWEVSLKSAGVGVRRCDASDLYRWLQPWFNPQCSLPKHCTFYSLPTVGDSDLDCLPFGYDFAEGLCLTAPQSNAQFGCWLLNEVPHAIVPVLGLRQVPRAGHFTSERFDGEHQFTLFDRMPEGTILSITTVLKAQDQVRNHLGRVKRASVGDSPEAMLTREDAVAVEREMVRGNKLLPTTMGFFVRGDNHEALEHNLSQVHALLLSSGIQPIARDADLMPLDNYIRALPMVFDPSFPGSEYRLRLMFSRHLSSLLPVTGRSRGTGNNGIVFFNRGAEPLGFDPLHSQDRKKNAHMLILGPTGAGKSAMLVYLIQQMMARHRPRLFIIEAGGSFSLLGDHFQKHGVTVNQVSLNPGCDVSLPPFAGAIEFEPTDHASLASSSDSDRDRLGEMEIIARIMITGGEAREVDRMGRSDRLVIRRAILHAAKNAASERRSTTLTEDVVAALRELASSGEVIEARKQRISEMADGMALFCSGIAGHFFNREGKEWPEADVTILEMGLLSREGYGDQLVVAYLSMMNHINDLVERRQYDERPTIVITDEGHVITTHPLLASYVVKITKMWRKLGAWFWIATQNLADFPNESRKMLSMMEWWLCLTTPKEEVDEIARFRELTDPQRRMLLSARKEPGKYVEGVLLSDSLDALFRNVPPPLSLALAMTEKHEKAARRTIMDERGCTELEAAEEIARQLERSREREEN